AARTRPGTEPAAVQRAVQGSRPPGSRDLAATALFYNIGFFTLLAFSPFPLGFGAMGIGLTFFGWGVGLAITSVWVARVLPPPPASDHGAADRAPLLAVDL
ncbi:MFS transporter, partial [Microbacterium sp. SUBG005]